MKIGTLKMKESGALEGSLETRKTYIELFIEPIARTATMTDDSPTHRILTPSANGSLVECGAAWKKKSREAGRDYLSLNIDDMDMERPISCAAFPGKGDEWELVWNRPQQQAA